MKFLPIFIISVFFFSCGDNGSKDPQKLDGSTPLKDSVKATLKIPFKEKVPELLSDSVNFYRYIIQDTIHLDLNCDGFLDKIYFSSSLAIKHIIFHNGKTNHEQTFGETGPMKEEIGTDYSWVDFWGITKDTSTWEAVIEDGEILGSKSTSLRCPSLVLRKDEAGGGIVTFKDGDFQWIHQAD